MVAVAIWPTAGNWLMCHGVWLKGPHSRLIKLKKEDGNGCPTCCCRMSERGREKGRKEGRKEGKKKEHVIHSTPVTGSTLRNGHLFLPLSLSVVPSWCRSPSLSSSWSYTSLSAKSSSSLAKRLTPLRTGLRPSNHTHCLIDCATSRCQLASALLLLVLLLLLLLSLLQLLLVLLLFLLHELLLCLLKLTTFARPQHAHAVSRHSSEP